MINKTKTSGKREPKEASDSDVLKVIDKGGKNSKKAADSLGLQAKLDALSHGLKSSGDKPFCIDELIELKELATLAGRYGYNLADLTTDTYEKLKQLKRSSDEEERKSKHRNLYSLQRSDHNHICGGYDYYTRHPVSGEMHCSALLFLLFICNHLSGSTMGCLYHSSVTCLPSTDSACGFPPFVLLIRLRAIIYEYIYIIYLRFFIYFIHCFSK